MLENSRIAALAALAALTLAAVPTHAGMSKCVDEKGVTYYYDRVQPPECLGKPTTDMTNKGVVIRKREGALTPEQIQAREADAAKKKQEEQKARDDQRRDKAILNTYTTEEEIDIARDRNLQPVQHAIRSGEPRLKLAREKLSEQKKRADGLTQAGKQVPEHMREDLVAQEREVKRMEEDIARRQQELEQIKGRFEADKLRFRELTPKKP